MMRLLACFLIASCLLVGSSPRSVTDTEDETGIRDLQRPPLEGEDGKLAEDFCNPNPCKNGGECLRYSKKCSCPSGYSGVYCEMCKCENGSCKENDGGDSVCACPPEWGLHSPTKCKKCDCGVDSNCTFDVGWFGEIKTCLCKVGYEDLDGTCVGTCKNNPCLNGGECTVRGNHIECRCKDQFSGNRCENKGFCKLEENIAKCNELNRTCERDGKQEEGFRCVCRKGEIENAEGKCIDVCSPNPCQNGGICNSTGGGATCQCRDRFRSADCSIDVCSPNPCRNGGVCYVTKGGAICQCRERFRGADCSIEIPFPVTSTHVWRSFPTRNSTFLSTRSPTTGARNISTRSFKPTYNITFFPTLTSSGGHFLNSTFSTESTRRLTTLVTTTGVDPCTGSPCQNGATCVVDGNRPKCFCKKPYLGNRCETDPCNWNPCMNGGVCKIEYETVKCFCRDPFTGEFCESRIRIDTYVIVLVAASVFLAILLTLVACILCQRYHVIRPSPEST